MIDTSSFVRTENLYQAFDDLFCWKEDLEKVFHIYYYSSLWNDSVVIAFNVRAKLCEI